MPKLVEASWNSVRLLLLLLLLLLLHHLLPALLEFLQDLLRGAGSAVRLAIVLASVRPGKTLAGKTRRQLGGKALWKSLQRE